jgi:hypothetical protein
MDSDEDLPDEGKPSTSSGKGPPPVKRPKPLTAAEKKKRNRASQSAEKKMEESLKNKERKAKKRATQSADQKKEESMKNQQRLAKQREAQSADKKMEESLKNQERKAKKRATQSADHKKAEYLNNQQRLAKKRESQSADKKVEESAKNRERDATTRAGQSSAEKNEANVKACERMSRQRHKARTKVSYKEGLRSQEIMDGSYLVPDLENTDDKIGDMNIGCEYCGALKFKKETSSTCCGNGKVILDPFPTPPPEINNLWNATDTEGRIFRENTRAINNSVCLTSIKVNQRKFGGRFNPSVIFEGKVQQLVGPLQAQEGEDPCFAQLYVHDPSLETSQRFKNMTIPANMSSSQKRTLEKVLKTVQDVIHNVNPFVKDFKQIIDIPADELGQGKIVLSAKARPSGEHERRYNNQLNLHEVSILTNSQPHDLVLQQRGGALQSISDLNPKCMPLHFTLLFPHGTYGWNQETKHRDGVRRVTTREFYVFHMNIREVDMGNYLHLAGRLFQEWLCMAWVAVENQKLNYQRMNQKALRADSYQNIKEATQSKRRQLALDGDGMFGDDNQQPPVGRKILSSSFQGGPRWYNAKFQDGMAICREYHKPDYFITMTCNPHWPEIERELKVGQKAQDRPDLVARVFKQKKDQLMQDLKTGDLLGEVVAHMHVIEFQKRGLPHAHILIILADGDRTLTPELVDSIVVAELPPAPEDTDDPSEAAQRKRLQDIVLTNMVHGPCGAENPSCPCMENGRCTKSYPKEFKKKTTVDTDSYYATYRRRAPEDGGRQMVCSKTGRKIDNRWIVPYNPYLSLRNNCHINIERCTSPKAAKYLYKYITKGSDRAMVATEIEGQPRDEIADYEDLRSVGSSEAAWHLLAFSITERYPPVQALRIHTEDQQQVVFDEGTEEEALERQRETELTAFFQLNSELVGGEATDIQSLPIYVELPKKYRYDKSKKKWLLRKARSEDTVIGRVHTVNPLAGEAFYLRMLLHNDHCKGKTSFQDMLILPQGQVCETYQQVCCELGLLTDDTEWQRVLEESVSTKMCPQIRELFVTILMFCQPANPRALYDEFWTSWIDDFEQQARRRGKTVDEKQLETMLLLDLELRLQSFEKQLAQFSLPQPTQEDLSRVELITSTEPVVIREEKEYDVTELASSLEELIPRFTEGQSDIFTTIMGAVKEERQLCVFIDARGGCGKTFILNAILAAVRSLDPDGCVALAMGTTGIAANLLQLGRTYHSRMKAPLTPTEDSTLQISAQSSLAKLVRMARLLMIDEATMLDRFQLEALDRSLRDLMGKSDLVFGGKVLVLAGDISLVFYLHYM